MLGARVRDPAEWGKNFPREYDGYIRTADNAKARFKWSEGRPPDDEAHDAGKAESKLAEKMRAVTGGMDLPPGLMPR